MVEQSDHFSIGVKPCVDRALHKTVNEMLDTGSFLKKGVQKSVAMTHSLPQNVGLNPDLVVSRGQPIHLNMSGWLLP